MSEFYNHNSINEEFAHISEQVSSMLRAYYESLIRVHNRWNRNVASDFLKAVAMLMREDYYEGEDFLMIHGDAAIYELNFDTDVFGDTRFYFSEDIEPFDDIDLTDPKVYDKDFIKNMLDIGVISCYRDNNKRLRIANLRNE